MLVFYFTGSMIFSNSLSEKSSQVTVLIYEAYTQPATIGVHNFSMVSTSITFLIEVLFGSLHLVPSLYYEGCNESSKIPSSNVRLLTVGLKEPLS